MITHVAIKDKGDWVWSLEKPNRHHNLIHLINEQFGKKLAKQLLANHIQGFRNDKGDFLTREEAFIEALNSKQIKRELFSEDLW